MSRREYRKLQQQQEQEAEKAKAKQLKEENGNEKENADSEESDNENLIGDAGTNLGAKAKMPPHRNPFDLVSLRRDMLPPSHRISSMYNYIMIILYNKFLVEQRIMFRIRSKRR